MAAGLREEMGRTAITPLRGGSQRLLIRSQLKLGAGTALCSLSARLARAGIDGGGGIWRRKGLLDSEPAGNGAGELRYIGRALGPGCGGFRRLVENDCPHY